jgi:hypothetical protein
MRRAGTIFSLEALPGARRGSTGSEHRLLCANIPQEFSTFDQASSFSFLLHRFCVTDGSAFDFVMTNMTVSTCHTLLCCFAFSLHDDLAFSLQNRCDRRGFGCG